MEDKRGRSDKVRELAIFPLPLVMLPQEALPLHIFEPRYRQMLVDVQTGEKQFGIVHFDPENSLSDRPDIDSVGCIAVLRTSQLLDDGRSNITTVGAERFLLRSYVSGEKPYLVAQVELFEDDDAAEPDKLKQIASQSHALFVRMAAAAFRLSSGRGEPPAISDADPVALSFLIAAAFNFENARKEALLRMTSTYERLSNLKDILSQAVTQLESNAEIQTVSKTNGHGGRKIDL